MVSKVLIFDFDGVILDSVNIKTEAFRELFKNQNINLSYHLSLTEVFPDLFVNSNIHL